MLAASNSLLSHCLLKLERGVLQHRRDHDERRFAARFAKIAGSTKNAEAGLDADFGQRGEASESNLPTGEDRAEKALQACSQRWHADHLTSARASAYLPMVLVEQHHAGDELIAKLGVGEIAGEYCLYHLGRYMDAFRLGLGYG